MFCFLGLLFLIDLLSKLGQTIKDLLNFKALKVATQQKVTEGSSSLVEFGENAEWGASPRGRGRKRWRKGKAGEKDAS